MSYTTPPTKASGESVTVANWNTHLKGNLDALYEAPVCVVNNSAGTVTSTSAVVPFATETFDTHSMHDTSTNNSRITVPAGAGGLYHVMARCVTDASNIAFLRIDRNGSGATGTFGVPVSEIREISAVLTGSPGDYFEVTFNPSAQPDIGFQSMEFTALWLRGPV